MTRGENTSFCSDDCNTIVAMGVGGFGVDRSGQLLLFLEIEVVLVFHNDDVMAPHCGFLGSHPYL